MAGRFKTDDFLAGLETVKDAANKPICINSPNYSTHKRNVCSMSDLTLYVSADPSAPCDATSWAFHFTARPALLSGVAELLPAQPNCQPEDRPANDSCANLE